LNHSRPAFLHFGMIISEKPVSTFPDHGPRDWDRGASADQSSLAPRVFPVVGLTRWTLLQATHETVS
jgi:hypothetical protein